MKNASLARLEPGNIAVGWTYRSVVIAIKDWYEHKRGDRQREEEECKVGIILIAVTKVAVTDQTPMMRLAWRRSWSEHGNE